MILIKLHIMFNKKYIFFYYIQLITHTPTCVCVRVCGFVKKSTSNNYKNIRLTILGGLEERAVEDFKHCLFKFSISLIVSEIDNYNN